MDKGMDMAPSVRKRNPISSFIKKNGSGYLLCAPLLLGIFIFVFYPMLQVILYSFQATNGMSGRYIGVGNYRWILNDKMFWASLKNTAYMAVMAIVIDVVVCFCVASLINSVIRTKNFFKSLYFLPNVVSAVAVSLLFNFLFFPTKAGIINSFLGLFGIAPVGWLVKPAIAPFSMVIMGLWRSVGYDTILFLAGLQSIPREIYEAGEVDGATGLQRWWYITIPSMRPIIVFIVMMLTISTMRRFDDIWMIGGVGGNPGGSLQTVVLYIYRNAWVAREVGTASAASVVLFLVVFIVTLLNNKLLNRDMTI
ncbi:MAG: sugar ABC transporter permease [Clostridia bacterium]|nr:sugar ABC transporter permease [Clostridia bacterium]